MGAGKRRRWEKREGRGRDGGETEREKKEEIQGKKKWEKREGALAPRVAPTTIGGVRGGSGGRKVVVNKRNGCVF